MQLSRYTLMVENYPDPGEHLVYNTRTQALVKIGSELKEVLDGFPHSALVPVSQETNVRELFRLGVLVKDEGDDVERFNRFIERKKYGIDPSLFVASILTTYGCNFACTYCFEESTRSSAQKLDRRTSDMAMEWLKKKLLRHRIRQLVINYYGGEPLLNKPEIEYISKAMRPWCETNGVGFRFMLQTNGALLTKELVGEYKQLGLYKAKISLDGTREVHDRQRPMRGTGAGTFDAVVRNIVGAIGLINVSVAAGYNHGDTAGILELIDYLDSIGVLRKLEKFSWTPIHPSLGPKGHTDQIVSPECMNNYSSEVMLAADRKIKEALAKKGLPIRSGLVVSMCPVTTGDSGVTIDTQGAIFKCNAMLGHPELAVGSIYEEDYNEKQKEFMAGDDWKKCDADCPYAPMCNTGCRLFAFFKTQDFTGKSCEREYMDKFVPQAIKMEYQKRMEAKRPVHAA